MTLVVDHRAQLAGAPGLHALVIGVGDYPNLPGAPGQTADVFDMQSVTCTVPTAIQIAQWLIANAAELPVPLATVRVLLSPPGPPWPNAAPATLTNVQKAASAWRTDASSHRDGYTLFYFAGHGVARSRGDSVMLLEGFNQPGLPLLTDAIDSNTLFYGMAPSASRPQIARNQFFFVDACRATPAAFAKFEPLICSPCFNLELSTLDDRRAPLFYAALEQGIANGLASTAFGTALLECLAGDAATDVSDDRSGRAWCVTSYSIASALSAKCDKFNQQNAGSQDFVPTGISKNVSLRHFPAPPPVDVEVVVDPEIAAAAGTLGIKDGRGVDIVPDVKPVPLPYRRRVPAGLYVIRCRFEPPVPAYRENTVAGLALPPKYTYRVPVT